MKKSTVFIPGKSKGFRQLILKRPELPMAFRQRFIKTGRGRRWHCVCDQLVDTLLIGWWWGNWESVSSTSQSGVYVLVGSMQLTSPTWWGCQWLQNSPRNLAQNIIYSPWRVTKGLWICLLAQLLIPVLNCCPLSCIFCIPVFPLSLYFLTSLIKYILWKLGNALGG